MPLKVKTSCPVCQATYKVPAESVGHKARCSQCQAKFRVTAPPAERKGPPTEDDILDWLNEGMEEAEQKQYQRGGQPRGPRDEPRITPPDHTARLESRPPAMNAEDKKETSPANRLANPAAGPLQFRKTG
jgi:hypothetical protein